MRLVSRKDDLRVNFGQWHFSASVLSCRLGSWTKSKIFGKFKISDQCEMWNVSHPTSCPSSLTQENSEGYYWAVLMHLSKRHKVPNRHIATIHEETTTPGSGAFSGMIWKIISAWKHGSYVIIQITLMWHWLVMMNKLMHTNWKQITQISACMLWIGFISF